MKEDGDDMAETKRSAGPVRRGDVASGPLSGWIVLWSFAAFIAAAAGQMSLIIWLPRLMPVFDEVRYLLAFVVIVYWLALAVLFAWWTGRQIHERVEKPMLRLGEAAGRVARGDFSVYVAPEHVKGGRDWNATDQMFADFNTMVEELGGIETMKNDFVSNVSHEIRNPLAVIRNYATLLRDADPDIVSLIWSNVLGNALKYTAPGGHVRVCQRSDGGMVTVEIADDGCGMSEEETARIFDKFYQGDTSHATQGNGLGMAMVRRAVDLSRGFIDVHSIKGQDTAITVRLPMPAVSRPR